MNWLIALVSCTIVDIKFSLAQEQAIPEGRILGGQTSGANQFPWMVQIRVRSLIDKLDFIGTKRCGGSIVTVYWILTAAQCATVAKRRYIIVAGSYDDLFPNLRTIQPRLITRKKIHPMYKPSTGENDIALMRVYPPFVFDNSSVGSIAYPHFNFIASGTGSIAGWGSREKNDFKGSRFLQTGLVPILPNSECQALHPNRTIHENQLCGTGNISSPCNGDEGGPLVCNRGGIPILCGIISDTKGCERGLLPKVFTRTSSYYDWIQVGTTI